jgi:hypothetical protein
MGSRERGVSTVLVLVLLLFLVVGLLATYALTRFTTSLQDRNDTVSRLRRVADALDAYAGSARRLPCPADPTLDTGVEVQASASTCTHLEGTLPWRTIGLRRDDAFDEWGFKISYRVYVNGGDGSLTQPRGIDMTHCDAGQTASEALAAGRVCTESTDPHANNQSAALFLANKGLRLIDMGTDLSNRAYVLISHGESGLGAYTSSGAQRDMPVGDERDNARSGPYVIKAFSDPDVEATKNAHFDDLLFYRTVEDVAKRAGLAARDWPESLRFDAATVAAAAGNANPDTGRNSFTYRGTTITASSGNVSFSSAGGTSGIGVVDSGADYSLVVNEYIRMEFSQVTSKAVITLAGFGHFDLLGTRFREQVRLRFYDGSSAVGSYVRQACRANVDGLATLELQAPAVGVTFNRVELEPEILSPNFLGFSSSLLLAEATACGPTVASCRTGLQTVANTCATPSLTGASFAPGSIAQGASSVLSFTLANGTDNPAHAGMAFNAALPAGLTIANPASPATTCAAASIAATPGASSFAVSGLAVANGAASCTVQVSVSASGAGSYGVDASAVTGSANLPTSAGFSGAALTVTP